jgi:hypothetical protein
MCTLPGIITSAISLEECALGCGRIPQQEPAGPPQVSEDGAHRLGLEIGASDLPRRERHQLPHGQDPRVDELLDRRIACAGVPRGLQVSTSGSASVSLRPSIAWLRRAVLTAT